MNAPFNPKEAITPDAIDFELVPVDAARAVHDEPPAGVESLPTLVPGYWVERRRKPGASDRALTGSAIDWLLALPAAVRPKLLCERYPRVVNAVAAAAPGAVRSRRNPASRSRHIPATLRAFAGHLEAG